MQKETLNELTKKLETALYNLNNATEKLSFSINVAKVQIQDALIILREVKDDSDSSDRL